jgi:transcriptional regulator with XRE-family HTH domain
MAAMATRPTKIRGGARLHVYIDQWFEAKGVNDEKVAQRLGRDRTTIWKWRTIPSRQNAANLIELAHALDIEVKDFFRLPSRPSIDLMIADAPEDLQNTAADIVQRLVKRGAA